MDLFEEELLKQKNKPKTKISTKILIAVAILSILSAIILGLIIYIKGTILTITLDGKNAKDLENIFIMEENSKVYMPIKKMAEYLGYDAFNGDYVTRSEDDKTKCYIETEEEVVSFSLNSNVITKVINGQSGPIKISEPVKEINGELCVESKGAQDAFNFKFYYDVSKNNITIQTLSYLYNAYSQYAVNTLKYLPIEQVSYANKSAILDDMLIVKGQNGSYGVITIKNETILETKYDGIEFLRNTNDFLVESNKKKGIISTDQKTKVELVYDSIQEVSNKNDIFYIVKKSGLFGLLDGEGKTIIYPEYEQIGVDVSAYSQNGVTNGYILYNQLIPVKSNNKWGIIDINGNTVTDFLYDSFGCPNPKNYSARTYGVIEVFDYNLIVVCKEGKYNLINIEGDELFRKFVLDSVYITVSEGENIYYITSGETTKELISFLQDNGVSKPTPIE